MIFVPAYKNDVILFRTQ